MQKYTVKVVGTAAAQMGTDDESDVEARHICTYPLPAKDDEQAIEYAMSEFFNNADATASDRKDFSIESVEVLKVEAVE